MLARRRRACVVLAATSALWAAATQAQEPAGERAPAVAGVVAGGATASAHADNREQAHGERRVAVNLRAAGRRSWLFGVGYQRGLRDPQIDQLCLQVGFGWTLFGAWTAHRSPGRFGRLYGTATYVHVAGELAVPIGSNAATNAAASARVSQVLALGRHALAAVASIGPRWDIAPGEVGLRLTMGLGYALVLPPVGVPVEAELVRESGGAFEEPAWGWRVTLGWPLSL